MGNKIIIDEEVLAKLGERISDAEKRLAHFEATQMEYSMHSSIGLVKGLKNAKQLILENSTTISIDESIEQNFETLLDTELNKLPYEKHLDDGLIELYRLAYNDGFNNVGDKKDIIKHRQKQIDKIKKKYCL